MVGRRVDLPIEPEAIDERLTYIGEADIHNSHDGILAENERLISAGIDPIQTVIFKGLDIYLTSPERGDRMDWFRRLNDDILKRAPQLYFVTTISVSWMI